MSQQVSKQRESKNAGTVSVKDAKDRPPAELEAALAKVAALLAENQGKEALEYIGQNRSGTTWMRNAAGVCHLRMGNATPALDTLKGLALGSSGLDLKDEAPTVFKTNYGVALLQAGNRDGFFRVLEELAGETHPALERLRDAVKAWKASMSFFQRVWWRLGGTVPPLTLPFAPGDLM